MIRPVSPTFPARSAAISEVRPQPASATPARVSPARLPDTASLGWAMVNLGLLTLLLGVLPRLF